MRRLGERAFARHFDIEITFGLHGTEPDHSHPGPGNNRRAEMPVELNDGCQPCRIGRLAVVMGLGKAVGYLGIVGFFGSERGERQKNKARDLRIVFMRQFPLPSILSRTWKQDDGSPSKPVHAR